MRPVLAVITILLAACGEVPGPVGDDLAVQLRQQLTRPEAAAYLIDQGLAEAESVTPRPGLAVRILHRRDTAAADRMQLKLQITGELEVLMLPPPDERLLRGLPAEPSPAERARIRAQLRQSQLEQAKRVPAEKRTRLLTVARQVPVQVQRVADGWRIVLPDHLERGGGAP